MKKNTNTPRKKDRRTQILCRMYSMPDHRFSIADLASASGQNDRAGRRETVAIVEQLCDEGAVEHVSHGKVRLTKQPLPTLEGVCDMLTSGALYVKVEGEEHDIFVHQHHACNALHGDRVEVEVMSRRPTGESEGRIVRILERSRKTYTGVADVSDHCVFVRPDSRRMPYDIYLSKKRYPDLQSGEKVAIRILDWPETAKSPEGELIDRLGMAGENNAEMHAILSEYDLPYRFEPEVEEAARAIPGAIDEAEIARRRDFRTTTTFTVDPADAKDFDDALSVRRVKEGVWEVGVHIADVTHYVRPHSAIDEEAVARGTSVYLVDRTVPMLPERLSNELCSLRPDEDSLCFSAVFTLNDAAELLDEWFGRTVIHSDRRFTYEEAQQVIESGRGDYAEEVQTLHRLAQELRSRRFRSGAIAFEREEMKFRLDEQSRPLGVYFKVQREANQMIEEFMLLANRRVAEFCAHRISERGRKVPRTMVFRIHDKPSDEKLERFREFALRFGHSFRASKGRAVARQMNKLMAAVRGRAEENALSIMAVRTMAKACYSTDNIGHYGLAFPYYTHFTSPIRRYPDMMVHRLLARYLAGGKSADRRPIEELCEHASDREVLAAEAERASFKYKMVEFMKERIGQEYEGHVSGMSEGSLFIELDENHIEGMTFLRDLEDDYYQFDRERYELQGHRTGRRLTLGDPVRIRVRRADLQKRLLEFEVICFRKPIR